ncbi:MAG: tetratricopeptide repeat protein [Fibrobacteres bacterium]|nr:tetratricopeptide repeat protein [Fibrobacterota bacterium]
MKKLIIITILAISAFAGDMENELFKMANKAFEAGRYDSAAALYTKIIDAGYHDADVYYNLGNTFFRQKKLGEAILNYERAYWLNESDADIKANIEYTRALTKDKIVPAEQSMFFTVLLSIHNLLSLRMQAILIAVLLIALALFLTAYFSLDTKHRSWIKVFGIAAILLLVGIAPSFLIKRAERSHSESAIVLAMQANILNEPNGSEILFTVHEGAKFKIIRKVDDYAFASLENGLAGWINLKELGIIEIRQHAF